MNVEWSLDLPASANRADIYRGMASCSLAVMAVYATALWWMGSPKFPNDDAYIALHNAQVLWQGYDSAYIGVPALIGATSAVHLALLVFFESFIHSADMALFVLSFVAACSYAIGVYVMCLCVGCSPRTATLFGVGSLFLGGSAFQLLNGLETGLAMSAVAWDLALLISRRKHPVALSVVCGLMPFVRPELTFLAGASILILVLDNEFSVRTRIVAVGIAAATAAPFVLWYWIDTGSPVPSSIAAKTYFIAQTYLSLGTRMFFFRLIALALLAVSPLWLCCAFIQPRAVRAACLLFIVTFVAAYFWRYPSALFANVGRYLFIFAPIIILGSATMLVSAQTWKRPVAQICLAISLLSTACAVSGQGEKYVRLIDVYRKNLIEVVAWTNSHLPSGSEVMVHDAGYVSYAGRFRLIDVTGLKTPACILVHQRLTFPTNGMKRPEAIAEIANSFDPTYLIAVKDWETNFGFAEALRANGWRVTKIYESSVQPDVSDTDIYQVYELHPSRDLSPTARKTNGSRPAAAH